MRRRNKSAVAMAIVYRVSRSICLRFLRNLCAFVMHEMCEMVFLVRLKKIAEKFWSENVFLLDRSRDVRVSDSVVSVGFHNVRG